MDKPKSKAQLRAELQQQVNAFLQRGGAVERVAQGISGQDTLQQPRAPTTQLFTKAPAERTPVDDVIAAIEKRRAEMRRRNGRGRTESRSKQRRQRWIYDDFGEPIRRVWLED